MRRFKTAIVYLLLIALQIPDLASAAMIRCAHHTTGHGQAVHSAGAAGATTMAHHKRLRDTQDNFVVQPIFSP